MSRYLAQGRSSKIPVASFAAIQWKRDDLASSFRPQLQPPTNRWRWSPELDPSKDAECAQVSCGRAAVAMTTAILDELFSSGASDGDVAVQPRGDKLGLIGSTQENFCFFFW